MSLPDSWPEPPKKEGIFVETPWAVLSCPAKTTAQTARAREELCQKYWRPIFAIIIARGYDCEQARDLTQGFMLHLFKSNAIAAADPARGRFRDFLRGALAHYLADLRDRERALCRGGGALHLSLDDLGSVDPGALCGECALPGCNVASDRAWAQRLLDRVYARLEDRYTCLGRVDLFHCLKSALTMGPGARLQYVRMAKALGRPAASVRSEARRLHTLFRRYLLCELRRVVGPERLAEEWQNLREILRGK